MMQPTVRALRALPSLLAAGVLLALAGCAGTASPAAGDAPTAGASTPRITAYPMPDLGSSPAPAAMDAATRDRLRLEQQDSQWQGVTTTYPDAVRPDDPFREYRDSVAAEELTDCFDAAGLPVDLGTDAAGSETTGVLVSPTDQAQAVAAFACWSAYPTTPIAPMTTEQIDYLYRYLTDYLVPCYEANGIEVPAAPSRADFVSRWPEQGWFPSTSAAALTPEREQAIDQACVRPV